MYRMVWLCLCLCICNCSLFTALLAFHAPGYSCYIMHYYIVEMGRGLVSPNFGRRIRLDSAWQRPAIWPMFSWTSVLFSVVLVPYSLLVRWRRPNVQLRLTSKIWPSAHLYCKGVYSITSWKPYSRWLIGRLICTTWQGNYNVLYGHVISFERCAEENMMWMISVWLLKNSCASIHLMLKTLIARSDIAVNIQFHLLFMEIVTALHK